MALVPLCFRALLCWQLAARVAAHGKLSLPESSRQNGTLARAGWCEDKNCFWFSGPVYTPGPPTVNGAPHRTYNVNVTSGNRDWSRHMPWRAPGSAPVYGSGCGAAGGGPERIEVSGNTPPPGIAQGADALKVLKRTREPTTWRRGAEEEASSPNTAPPNQLSSCLASRSSACRTCRTCRPYSCLPPR